jgi:hypothetical protein
MYKIICIGVIILVILSIIFNLIGDNSMIEGLENNVSESDITESQNAAIQSKIVMLDDQLMINKYKRQYENMIINMDDYINLMMIQQILKIKFDSGVGTTIEGLDYLNTLKSAKDSLNVAMKFLDKR